MITHLEVHNVKAFEQAEIELRPLTFLLGPNNSGKSSLIAPLRLLAQTAASYDPHVSLLLNGSFGDFGTYKDLVFSNHRGKPLGISLRFKHFKDEESYIGNVKLNFKYRTQRREIILRSYEVYANGKRLVWTNYSSDTGRQLIDYIGDYEVPSHLKGTLPFRTRQFTFIPHFRLPIMLRRGRIKADVIESKYSKMIEEAEETNLQFIRQLNSIDYIGPIRQAPERTYLFTGERRKRIGTFGENAISILVADTSMRGRKSVAILEQTSSWMNKAGIASSVLFKPLTDRHYEIRFSHPQTKEDQNIADVGYGNSQVLPVLVGGYNRPSDSCFIVEQPEIHLHPAAQAELGTFFLDLYNNEVQSIVETHSEHIILRIQQHVVRREIDPKDVVVYYISPKGGKKSIHKMRLNKKGTFIEEWPEGFFPQRLDEARKLAQLRLKFTGGK